MNIEDIEDIKKFTQDKNAWYHITVPSGMSKDDMMLIKRILANSEIKGTILLTGSDYKIEDITERVK